VGERERDRMGGVLGERREFEVLLASVKESEKNKKENENSEKERERAPPRRAGESLL